MSHVLHTVNGVEITREMTDLVAERFHDENVDSNLPGFCATIAGWIMGYGTLDAYLTDSPETREVFKPVRDAYFRAHGQNPEEVAFSNVTFAEGVQKGREAKNPPVSTPENS